MIAKTQKVTKILIFVLCFAMLFTGCSNKKEKEPDIPNPKEKTTAQFSGNLIKDKKGVYQIECPKDWKNTVDNKINKRTFTQTDTGSEISVLSEKYYPSINNTTQDSIAEDLQGNGDTLQSFTQQKGNVLDYTFTFTSDSDIQMIALRRLCWSHKKIYTIEFRTEQKYYDTFLNTFNSSLDSFAPTIADNPEKMEFKELWDIGEDMKGCYLPNMQVYFEYPLKLPLSAFDGGATITDEANTASITVTSFDAPETFSLVNAEEYKALIDSSISNTTLTNFVNSGHRINGTLTYVSDDVEYTVYNALIDKQKYTLSFTCAAPTQTVNNETEIFENIILSAQTVKE